MSEYRFQQEESQISAPTLALEGGVALSLTSDGQPATISVPISAPVIDVDELDDFAMDLEGLLGDDPVKYALHLALFKEPTEEGFTLGIAPGTVSMEDSYNYWYEYTIAVSPTAVPFTPEFETSVSDAALSFINGETLAISKTLGINITGVLGNDLINLSNTVDSPFDLGRLLLYNNIDGFFVLVFLVDGYAGGGAGAPGDWLRAYCRRFPPKRRPWFCRRVLR